MALPPTWTLFGDEHLPHRLLLLARMIDRASARALAARTGLSLAEWRVLAYVGTKGRASAADVCTAFDIDRAEVSRAVAKLTEGGLVQREQDGENRKRLLLELTDKGRVEFATTRERRVNYFRAILADLSAEERALMEDCMLRIATRVDGLRQG